MRRIRQLAPASTDEFGLLLEVSESARVHPQRRVMLVGCFGLASLLGARVSVFCPGDGDDGLLLAVDRGANRLPRHQPGELVRLLGEHPMPTSATGLVPVQRSAPAAELPSRPGSVVTTVVPLGQTGVLVVDHEQPRVLPPTQQRLVVEIAAVIGRVIDGERAERVRQQQLSTASALQQLLAAGVLASSSMEAAQALATTTAAVLGVSTACTYLVDDDGLICELATYGATDDRDARLRQRLLGAPANGSPVWQRVVAGLQPGPDLITDTWRPGAVRLGGVADILGLRSMATIPLLSSDGPLGLVTCGDADWARDWQEHDRELLEQLALQGTVVVDNARLREAERREARSDALTGLGNRRAFSDELVAAITHAAGTGQRVAVMQIDLDRFKDVNVRFGHADGDRLLVAVGGRLRDALGDDAVLVARLGGDEFAAVLVGDLSVDRVEAAACRVAAALDKPIALAQPVSVEASVGIALFPDHAADAEQLKLRAERAMAAAKLAGDGQLVWRPELEADTSVEPGLLGELRRAIAQDELVLHYQPKLNLRTGRAIGVEALVRWQHPRLGLLGPDAFVPLAEQTGRIRSITNWVLVRAIAQAVAWRDGGLPWTVAVNVSARDVADPQFPDHVAGLLRAAGLPGERLVLEVTETSLMSDRLGASVVLSDLRRLGVQISLDDFGTGYTSLAYLHSLPVDEIKIDRAFLGDGERRYAVIRAVLALGAGLGMRTVTEGIEDAATASILTALGSDVAQGYYFSRPMPASTLTPHLAI